MEHCEVVLKRRFLKGFLCFELPKDPLILQSIKGVLLVCQKKHNDYVKVIFKIPYKKRTQGKKSQNSAIHGYAQQIANYTGDEMEVIKMYCKQRAIKRGYPVKRDNNGDVIISRLTGEPIPESSANCNTVEAGYLIDELIQLASELGITLYNE